MKIGIINNAANYLYFNVNFAKYLQAFGNEVVFLNTDKFISRQVEKKGLAVNQYPKSKNQISYYNENSGLIKYFKRLNNIIDTQKLIASKNREYSAAHNYLKNRSFDYILILNGAFNVETDVCKELSIKTFFFEHSYFPNAIQMDPKGVNSNASFSNLSYDDLLQFKYKQNPFQELKDFAFEDVNYKIAERYLYRIVDSKYNSFFSEFIKRKSNSNKAKKRFQFFDNETVNIKEGEKFILFPLQVNSDTQIILNSKYSSMYEAIDDILPALKRIGYKIVIKEHPMEVEPVDYSKYADNKQVFVVKKIDLDLFIEQAEFIVNINSSVGMQAVAKHKKVLLLGDSFYKNSPLSIHFLDINPDELKMVMDELVIDIEKTDRYIKHFKEHIFIDDHFYKPTIKLFERIRNRLV